MFFILIERTSVLFLLRIDGTFAFMYNHDINVYISSYQASTQILYITAQFCREYYLF